MPGVVELRRAEDGIRYRDEEGKTDFVRMLFGCIAATFFFLVLFQDVLGLVSFDHWNSHLVVQAQNAEVAGPGSPWGTSCFSQRH